MPPVREQKDQTKWLELGLLDLRSLDAELRSSAPQEIEAAQTIQEAVAIVARTFGLDTPETAFIDVITPLGAINVVRESLFHIVEKRQDARERYALYAYDTLVCPFEVWRVAYDDGSYRLAFIGSYAAKNQMLVVVSYTPEKVLWNFMHGEAKAINKHRHGELIHQRYSMWPRAVPATAIPPVQAIKTMEAPDGDTKEKAAV